MILVFKTNIHCLETVLQLEPSLSQLLPHSHWNFDLDDCDRILRVVGTAVSPQEVIRLLTNEGYWCEELEG